jgi:hypothetical protein
MGKPEASAPGAANRVLEVFAMITIIVNKAQYLELEKIALGAFFP